MEKVPSLRGIPGVKPTDPPLHVPVATEEPSLRNVTVLVPAQLTVNVGVVSDVTLSVEELPVSDAASRSGVPGADSVVSRVTLNASLSALSFPAASENMTVRS
jgi:hypothetical protein